ncbi:MAG: 3-oxoacyl-[acyl-carrier-protein] reductase [Paludibacteraceae bacterium]|nr:3-oxoacyl-[acyl-carrier-protein] reductase [Paludibacteraceae bacterium]
MNQLLSNKVGIVTGAARGIGNATARLFAKEGCRVAMIVRSINEKVTDTIEQIKADGGEVQAYVCDASSYEQVHTITEQVMKDFGRIDILVNNAGITKDNLLLRMTEEQWDNVINVNLKSAFNFIHAVSPHMMRQKSGSIISMSSVVGIYGNAGQANYAASKAGMIALTETTAKEFGSRGIRANAIAPGFILTDMTANLPQNTIDEFVKRIPMHRGGLPEEVANVALFLASDLSSYVSGQTIQVTGAM